MTGRKDTRGRFGSMSLVRAFAAIGYVTFSYLLLMFGAVDLPLRYASALSVVILIGFAVLICTFVPDRNDSA